MDYETYFNEIQRVDQYKGLGTRLNYFRKHAKHLLRSDISYVIGMSTPILKIKY